jgi:hypothetical protein
MMSTIKIGTKTMKTAASYASAGDWLMSAALDPVVEFHPTQAH